MHRPVHVYFWNNSGEGYRTLFGGPLVFCPTPHHQRATPHLTCALLRLAQLCCDDDNDEKSKAELIQKFERARSDSGLKIQILRLSWPLSLKETKPRRCHLIRNIIPTLELGLTSFIQLIHSHTFKMGLRDILKKKDDLAEDGTGPIHDEKQTQQQQQRQPTPEFTFIRTDTMSQDFIQPPGGDDDDITNLDNGHLSPTRQPSKSRRSMDFFRSSRSRSESVSSAVSNNSSTASGASPAKRRLSQRLHLRRQPESSEHVPQDLPDIVVQSTAQDQEGVELQWEKRATILAEQNELARSMPNSPSLSKAEFIADGVNAMSLGDAMSRTRSRSTSSRDGAAPVSSKAIDADIQEAIRLHEAGDYTRSTKIFGKLADENGANNPLSQVLYGLALRFVSHTLTCPTCCLN